MSVTVLLSGVAEPDTDAVFPSRKSDGWDLCAIAAAEVSASESIEKTTILDMSLLDNVNSLSECVRGISTAISSTK